MSVKQSKIYQKCPNPDCGFEANSEDAVTCQFCRTPLKQKQQHKPVKKSLSLTASQSNWSLKSKVLLVGIFLAGGGWYLIAQRNQQPLSISSTESVSTESIASDIKVYSTIKDVPNVPDGTFTYGGSVCFAALKREGLHQAIAELHPQFSLKYVEPEGNPGCSGGITQLLNQGLSFAQNAKPLTLQEQQLAQSRGKDLESIEVGRDGIVFYVNKSVSVNYLSVEQLKDIYSGKITNWQQLGFTNLALTPISLDPKTDEGLSLLMGQDDVITDRVKIVRDHTTAIRKVVLTPGAIAYGSAAILRGQRSIRPIGLINEDGGIPLSALLDDGSVNLGAFRGDNYPLTRKLYVVVVRDGSINEKAGVAYANFLRSEEGQEFIEKAGFVPKFWEE